MCVVALFLNFFSQAWVCCPSFPSNFHTSTACLAEVEVVHIPVALDSLFEYLQSPKEVEV